MTLYPCIEYVMSTLSDLLHAYVNIRIAVTAVVGRIRGILGRGSHLKPEDAYHTFSHILRFYKLKYVIM